MLRPAVRFFRGLAFLAFPLALAAAPVTFHLPAQAASDALVALAQQAKIEILFPSDELAPVRTSTLDGVFEPGDALTHLLAGTGFEAQRFAGRKFIVRAATSTTGAIRGRLLLASGDPAPNALVALSGTRLSTHTDVAGVFNFPAVPPGQHQLFAQAEGWQPLRIDDVEVETGRLSQLAEHRLQPARELELFAPYVVKGRSTRLRPLDDSAALLGPRRATGNLDLPRSENDALPFTIYTREQITRSGVVALNEFLQRAILESDAAARPPEQSAVFSPLGQGESFAGSTNLNLRGYSDNETVILVNGRRLPEVQTSVTGTLPPDVNFIPLSLIQQVEVLPASASALYNGNPVGGVINIVLRPDVTSTEMTTTYTNALAGYDAAQTSVSLQHGQSLLDQKLRLRVNAVLTRSEPPTEAELGYRRRHDDAVAIADDSLARATPNVRSIAGTPLFGPGTASFTSVTPGANGAGGLAAFAGRAGAQQRAFFDSPVGLAASPVALDSPFGRRQRREAYFGSVTFDPVPWLQLGVDATHSRTVVNRGLDVLSGNLVLSAASPLNPFGQDVAITLAESAPLLGEDYSEARITFSSVVAGALLRLPRDWRVSVDALTARNVVKFRGLAGVDAGRWQNLVDEGRYHPLRDTQLFGPPAEFYDSVLVYRGGRGRFITLGDYRTFDAAARVTNQEMMFPTGRGSVLGGIDYRQFELGNFAEQRRFGDGTPVGDLIERRGRTLERYSFFAEAQAPALPARWLPRWLRKLEADGAVRYVASDQANEVNTVPTIALRADFAGPFSLRGSVTSSKRFPTPQMSSAVAGSAGPGSGLNQVLISDPRRGNETYAVQVDEDENPGLSPEDALTQTAGVIFETGDDHRLRASLDFVDTRKTNEIIGLGRAVDVLNLESLFPDHIVRAAPTPDDPFPVGRATHIFTGSVHASSRHSQNWTLAIDYAWSGVIGGTLELRARALYYQRYERQLFANSSVVDQLNHPDGTAPNLLRYRATFGASWSNRTLGAGFDGQYFHSRRLPEGEHAAQGSAQIDPYWQFDVYAQADLVRLLKLKTARHGLRLQARVNNLSGFDYPKYFYDGAGSGVQPYADWRGRTYSLSLTATF